MKSITEINKLNAERVPMREFLARQKHYAQRARAGESFVVTRNKQDMYQIAPLPIEKKYTLRDLRGIAGNTINGETDLSQRVDEIVYGK